MGLMLVTSFLWGGNFVVAKTLVAHASPMTLTTVRWFIAIIVLVPLVWWKEKKLVPPKQAIVPLLLMGVTGVALFNIFQFLALERTTSTNAGLISTMNTISIALFSFVLLKEKITKWQLSAMVLSLFGVVLVLSKGNWQLLLDFQLNTGDLWMLAAVCVWGLYSVCSKWAMQTASPLMATLYAGIFGVLLLLPFTSTDFTFTNVNTSFILSMLYTGIISTVVCMVFWNIGVQKLGATTSGIFLNFNPIFTALLAYLFIGENMSWLQGIGGLIVIMGCYLFTHFKTKAPQAIL
ncbi:MULTISPECIES: DMT family transporter [Lysinibacillus]|uniref:DMT family transporter n=1 Tax=Lysinibacillus TaxID=400634 RepID=UPI0004D91A85|nr:MULTISPECIES: DMT family transporter [Lysinibacillus]MDC6266695.1 DMT family transporter [Lysinibacillus sphaericus]MCE4042625.1 DMT family transporter [Lysinibacillus fusiformis]MCT6928969.1 DMT family transporter [Lysinibacillus fusiformis]MCT6932127.1 DMT family transporter [Lysinibacillus fusiformis]MDN4969046.1 DMT family transporter [Lysinibacillus fusiformis]